MPDTIQFRGSYHPEFSLEALNLQYIKLQFYQLFYMGVKPGLLL